MGLADGVELGAARVQATLGEIEHLRRGERLERGGRVHGLVTDAFGG